MRVVKRALIKNNRGVSLVELMIGIAILSLIMSALFFFVSVTTKAINKNSTEAGLQLIAQTTSNQLQKAVMEAKNIAVWEVEDDLYTYLNCRTGLIDVKVLFVDETVFVFDNINNIIYFKPISGLEVHKLNDIELADIMKDENILSKQVKSFKVSLSTLNQGYVEIYFLFEKDQSTIEFDNKVQVRNYK